MLRYQQNLSTSTSEGSTPSRPSRRLVVPPAENTQSLSWGMGQLSALERTLSSDHLGFRGESLSQSSFSGSTSFHDTSYTPVQLTDEEIVDDEMQKWIAESISDAEMTHIDLLKFWKVS